MSPVCSIVVTIVALAMPLADLFEPLAVAGDQPGIARPHTHQVAAGEVEPDSGADDIDEQPREMGWHSGGAAPVTDVDADCCGFLHVPRGGAIRCGCATAAGIRGPPVRG